jgi:two-component system sensor histidine kinase FlrB
MSGELDGAWRELESRVAHLSAELAATRSARLAELAEKESIADKLSTLMEALPGAVLVMNSAAFIEDANPAAEKMLGAGLRGRNWNEVLAGATATPPSGDGEFDTHDQRRLVLAYSQLANTDARIALLADITESHALTQLLHREQRLRDLGDMAARLAHQLRTPLSSAMLYLAQLTGPQEARSVQVGNKVQERLRQIEQLIDGMLRYIQGAGEPSESLCLKQLLSDNCAAMKPQFERANVALELDLPTEGIPLRGQRQALDNAVCNLLDNALQCSDPDTHICVSLQRCGDAAELRVRDHGPGVEASLREQIFEPWFSTRPHGTGLGLAVVASAAHAHAGEVSVVEPRGGGSSFCMRLPLAAGY